MDTGASGVSVGTNIYPDPCSCHWQEERATVSVRQQKLGARQGLSEIKGYDGGQRIICFFLISENPHFGLGERNCFGIHCVLVIFFCLNSGELNCGINADFL